MKKALFKLPFKILTKNIKKLKQAGVEKRHF